MKQLILVGFAITMTVLLCVTTAEARTQYEAKITINVSSEDSKCIDQFYARVSDSNPNPKTGEHDTLVGKFTIENPNHDITHIAKTIKIDPKKVPSGLLREYATAEQHDQLIWKDYKHPYTPLKDTVKSKHFGWTHNIALNCGVQNN